MVQWTPDPTFYPSPRLAAKAPPEKLAYVASFDPARKKPEALAVVDVDPKSASYSKIVGRLDLPNAGDELHKFAGTLAVQRGWDSNPRWINRTTALAIGVCQRA
jgi:56kDa selenium binding protein (SBP56)